MRPAKACEVWAAAALILMMLNENRGDHWWVAVWAFVAVINAALMAVGILFEYTQ